MTFSRSERRGSREDYSSTLGAMAAAGSSGAPKNGTFIGQAAISAGVANNTGGFLTTGFIFTAPTSPRSTDFLGTYRLTILSTAAAAGGINFRFVFGGGGGPFALGKSFGNAGGLTAFKSQNFANTNFGPFCTFDCSGVAIIGAGMVDIDVTCVGVAPAGGTVDLQFQNIVGAETYTIGPDSSATFIALNP